METPILTALIAAIVTLAGWIYQRHKEERFKRLDARRRYLERQIEEFYGPLFTLVHAIFTHYQVLHKLTKTAETMRVLGEEQRHKIEAFYEDGYFLPLHERIAEIMRTKLYLIDGKDVPWSFFDYLEHSLQAEAQRRIYTQLQIGTIHVAGKDWPESFYDDVKRGFEDVMRKYEDSTQPLKEG